MVILSSMKCWSLLAIIWIFIVLLSFGAFSGSTPDVLISHSSVSRDGGFRAPARRSLLSDANQRPGTTLVASLDGTIYLLELGSLKPLWSFSSGPEIYSSYQAPVSHVSELGSNYYIDCGDDWELYAHNSRGQVGKTAVFVAALFLALLTAILVAALFLTLVMRNSLFSSGRDSQ